MDTLAGDFDQTLQLLVALGYQVRWRPSEWWTCAVLGHGAAVLGEGVDRPAALEHALGQMLSHPLARQLWRQHRDAAAKAGASDAGSAAAVQPIEAPVEAEGDAPVAADPQTAAPSDPAVEHAAPAPSPDAGAGAADPAPAPAAALQASAAAPTAAPAEPAAPHLRAFDLGRVDDALAALAALEDDIDQTQDIALLAAPLMRLQLVAWIATARDWQDRLGDDGITQRVSGLAARLGAMARRYWPGQVSALRLDARPSDCAALVGGAPRSWADVAELAEAAMAEATAVDEYGWADSAKLGAQPGDPRSRLGEAQAILRRLLPGIEDPSSAAAAQRARELRQDPPIKDMMLVARRLRWLRLSADPEPWGRAMGWLRWLTQKLAAAAPSALVELLAPEHRPSRDWARENGYSPQRGELRRVLADLPAPAAGAAPLIEWFLRAYKLINADDLAARLGDHRALLLALEAQQAFPGDGTARDRLRKVQKRLAAAASGPAVAPPPLPPEPAERADPAEAGPVLQARARLAGKRALLLGNRTDPHLERHLRDGLGLEQVAWCMTDSGSSVDAACERVRNRGYDVVLGLTSFISHTSEGVMRQACAAGGVPFVRAGKGRLVGCAVAVLRDLPAERAA